MTRRRKTKRNGKRLHAPAGHEQERERPRLPAKVDGVPPTQNLKKHPDEVYGDTEIPHRGQS